MIWGYPYYLLSIGDDDPYVWGRVWVLNIRGHNNWLAVFTGGIPTNTCTWCSNRRNKAWPLRSKTQGLLQRCQQGMERQDMTHTEITTRPRHLVSKESWFSRSLSHLISECLFFLFCACIIMYTDDNPAVFFPLPNTAKTIDARWSRWIDVPSWKWLHRHVLLAKCSICNSINKTTAAKSASHAPQSASHPDIGFWNCDSKGEHSRRIHTTHIM